MRFRGEDGWWLRIVWRAQFRPEDVVLLTRGPGVTVRELEGERLVFRVTYWVGLVFWLVFGPPFGLGMAFVGPPMMGIPLWVAPESVAYGSVWDPLWRIPMGLFLLGLAAIAIGQVVNIIACLRFRVRTLLRRR